MMLAQNDPVSPKHSRVKGLVRVYSGLKDINMEFFRRRTTAIIGPSGCGKSTLLRCLNRMNDLVQGFGW